MSFFNKKATRTADLYSQIEKLETERDSLNDRNMELRNEIQTLKHKRKLEDEDLKHLVKMREEGLELEHRKKVVETEREKDAAIAEVKDQYRDKMETALKDQLTAMQKMYGQILERLPNVNAKLSGSL